MFTAESHYHTGIVALKVILSHYPTGIVALKVILSHYPTGIVALKVILSHYPTGIVALKVILYSSQLVYINIVYAASSKHFCFQISPCIFSTLEIFLPLHI